MKLSTALSFATSAGLISHAFAQLPNCNYEATFTQCDYASVKAATGCTDADFDLLFPGIGDKSDHVESLCVAARAAMKEDFLPWEKVTVRGRQFDDSFFDGGSIFNTADHVGITGSLVSASDDVQRIIDIQSVVLNSGGIGFPQYTKNFDMEDGCYGEIAMCCWTANRDSPDGQMRDGDKNSEVCTHEMHHSPKSARVRQGTAIFADDADENNVRCHGFYWNDGPSNDYKGNMLFKVAMEEGLLNGYTRNIPGAPMCGCIEQMPVVTNAECTDVTVTETFKIQANDMGESTSIVSVGDADIQFGNCGGENLRSAYEANKNGETADLSDLILTKTGEDGTCADAVDASLSSHAYTKATGSWEPIAGRWTMYYPIKSSEEMRAIFDASANKIVRRRCVDCNLTHKEIYYRRFDESGKLPESFDLKENLLNVWNQENNVFNVDFKLYSTYEDALNNVNEWTYCNFGHVGFPRDCGPRGWVGSQWARFNRNDGKIVSFFIDTSVPV